MKQTIYILVEVSPAISPRSSYTETTNILASHNREDCLNYIKFGDPQDDFILICPLLDYETTSECDRKKHHFRIEEL